MVVLLVLGGLLVAPAPAPASATLPGRNGWIGYVTTYCDAGCYDHFELVDPKGKGSQVLGPDLDIISQVAFSPDGSLLASSYFQKIHVGRFARILRSGVDDDSIGPQVVPKPKCAYDTRPRWSPTGSQLIFMRLPRYGCGGNGGKEPAAIFKLDRRSGTVRQIGPGRTVSFSEDLQPDWSSRGEIVFENGTGLSVMDAAGDGLRRLTRGPEDRFPSWSPGGTQVVFTRYEGAPYCGTTYVVRRDGTGLRRLRDGCTRKAVWSPDGRRIALLLRTRLQVMSSRGGPGRTVKRIGDAVDRLEWQPLPR